MFQPSWVLPEQGYDKALALLKEVLKPYAQHGYFHAPDGARLYYEAYRAPGHDKAVLLVHGFTEFAEKYTEMVGCFFRVGYDVYLYEQRGHGRSERAVADLQVVHVARFSEYVADVRAFTVQMILPRQYVQIDLFSHSMGGAVAALFLCESDCPVRRAILSAPMIAPRTSNIPRSAVLLRLRQLGRKQGFEKPFSHAGHFNPRASFAHSSDNSPARFAANMRCRLSNECCQTSTGTVGWTYEAISLEHKLVYRVAPQIRVPMLLLSGTNDRVVKRGPQRRFARHAQACRFVLIPDGKHGLFTASREELVRYYTMIFSFLEAP